VTVFLRAGTGPIADTITPSIPTLVELYERILRRGLSDIPLIIDATTYERAEAEMKAWLKLRGYKTLTPANFPQRNFVIFGVPIVMAD